MSDYKAHGMSFWNTEQNTRKLSTYFNGIVSGTAPPNLRFVAVIHALADSIHFLDALSQQGEISKVLVKPRSINREAFVQISQQYDTIVAKRDKLYDDEYALGILENGHQGGDVAILDIGGYFSETSNTIKQKMKERFWGVVEDTENGHQKYERLQNLDACVYSVARSPLKYAEDNLVGHSVVFATEGVIRSFGDIINGKNAVVLGYGKIGKSAALNLKGKGLAVSVYDIDPVKRVQAMADGFSVHSNLRSALSQSDMIISSTGNLSISGDDFSHIKRGAYLSSVTSSDDELGLKDAKDHFSVTKAGDNIDLYENSLTAFYVLNDGNAVNFLYGSSAGNYISLVQGEILACVQEMSHSRTSGIHELPATRRSEIAEMWLDTFG